MKKLLLIWIFALFVCVNSVSAAINYYDDFDRVDSNDVGNGWSENEGASNYIQIVDEAVYFNAIQDVSIGRDLNITQPVNVTGNFTVISAVGNGRNFWIGLEVNSISTIIDAGYYLEYSFDDSTVKLWENNTQRASYPYVANTGEIQYFDFHVHYPDIYAYIWNDSVSKPATPTLSGTITWNSTYELASVYADKGVNNAEYYFDNFNATIAEVIDYYKGIGIYGYNAFNTTQIYTFESKLYDENGTLLNTNSTTSGYLRHNLTINGNYTVSFIANGYFPENYSFEYSNVSLSNNFSVSPVPSVNISFYDDQTFNLVTSGNSYAILLGDSGSYFINTSTGTANQGLGVDTEYDVQYWGDGYLKKYYHFSISPTEAKNISLYMTNVTENYENITAYIRNQYFNELEGAVLVVEKFDSSTSQYVVSERVSADFEGKVLFKGILYDEYYKFSIYYDGELLFTSTPTTIKSTELSFFVNVGTPASREYFDLLDLEYSLGFDENNNRFVFTYSNSDGVITSIKLVTSRIISSGSTTLNTTTSTSSSGTIYHYVTNTTGYSYKSCAYGYLYGNYELIDCESYTYKEEIPDSAKIFFGILLVLAIILFAFLGFSQSIALGLALLPIPIILFELIGFSSIGLPIALSIELLMVIVALVINKN